MLETEDDSLEKAMINSDIELKIVKNDFKLGLLWGATKQCSRYPGAIPGNT